MSHENYFSAFGFEPSFDIDLAKLGKAYREIQKSSHPDRFAHEEISVQRQAVQNSALNNEMYQTLQSGVKRGNYLLQLYGIDFDLESYTVDDTEMLLNQLKYREQLSEIKDNSSFDSLLALQQEVSDNQTQILSRLNELFSSDVTTNQTLIKASLCELQFFDKLAYECELVEEQLLD